MWIFSFLLLQKKPNKKQAEGGLLRTSANREVNCRFWEFQLAKAAKLKVPGNYGPLFLYLSLRDHNHSPRGRTRSSAMGQGVTGVRLSHLHFCSLSVIVISIRVAWLEVTAVKQRYWQSVAIFLGHKTVGKVESLCLWKEAHSIKQQMLLLKRINSLLFVKAHHFLGHQPKPSPLQGLKFMRASPKN